MKERKNMSTQTNTAEKSTQKIGARTLALVGMLSAVAVVLMTFDIPLPFAPTFYKIDFSEVPVLIGCFTMGPLAGVGIELIKKSAAYCYQRNSDSGSWRGSQLSDRMCIYCAGRIDLP